MSTSLAKELGPVLSGWLIGASLAGMLVIQTGLYFLQHGTRDKWYYVLAVLLLQLFSALAFADNFFSMWRDVILVPTHPALLTKPVPAVWLTVVASTCSAFVGQSVFAWRSFILSERNALIGCVLGFMVLTAFGFGLAVLGMLIRVQDSTVASGATSDQVKMWTAVDLSLLAGTDIAITIVLTNLLWPKRLGFNRRTDSFVTRIMLLSVTTAAITTVLYVVDAGLIIADLISPSVVGNAENAFSLVVPHVTGLVTVATLNLRSSLYPGRPPTSYVRGDADAPDSWERHRKDGWGKRKGSVSATASTPLPTMFYHGADVRREVSQSSHYSHAQAPPASAEQLVHRAPSSVFPQIPDRTAAAVTKVDIPPPPPDLPSWLQSPRSAASQRSAGWSPWSPDGARSAPWDARKEEIY